jgi:hypothetical protein
MSTAHRVPTASSSVSSAAARSDGRRMVGSRRGRAHTEQRHAESSSARRRRSATIAWEGRERERQWSPESFANGGGRGRGDDTTGRKASPTSPFIVRRRVRPGPTKRGPAGGDISYNFQTRQGTKTFFLVKIAKDLEMEDSISAAINHNSPQPFSS